MATGYRSCCRGAIYTGPNRVPVIASPASVIISENEPLSFAVNASDADGNVAWFRYHRWEYELEFEINASSGLLSFEGNSSTGMDFESPVDVDRDNVYLVTIGISDGIEMVDQNLTVTVTDKTNSLKTCIRFLP